MSNVGGSARRSRALLLIVVLAACGGSNSIPTCTVDPAPFVRIIRADGVLKATNATLLAAPQSAPAPLKIAWIADDGTIVKKGDVVVRFDPSDFQKDLLSGEGDRQSVDNKITKSDSEASTTSNNLRRDASQASAELDAAKKFRFDDAEAFSRWQRIESSIDEGLAADKKEHAENVLRVRSSLARADRDILGIDEKKADLKVKNAEQGLHSLEIRAPYDGILVLQRDWRGDVPRVGNTIWPGDSVGEIPDLRSMKAEIFVLEADAAGLAVGEKARVSLESNPLAGYSGKVTQVDKLARPRIRGVPVQYFGATVLLDRTDPKMKPGERVHAVLQVDARRNALTIPRQALFEKEGRKLVYRRRGETFEAVPVVIGDSSAGRVVIARGIAPGDVLAMRDPTLSSGAKTP